MGIAYQIFGTFWWLAKDNKYKNTCHANPSSLGKEAQCFKFRSLEIAGYSWGSKKLIECNVIAPIINAWVCLEMLW